MSALVKTALLQTLETLLAQTLPGVTIKRDWLFPLDLATLPLPALLFYEDHEAPGVANIQAKNELDLDLVYFAKFSGPVYDDNSPAWQEFKDAADVAAGLIHGLLHARISLLSLREVGLTQVEERGNRKAPSSETYGEMVLTVRLTYGHALGRAFIN